MNIRILVLWLMLAAPLVWAQESPKSAKVKAAERAAMLDTLQKGKEIKGSRGQYRHLPGVLAVAHGANETPQEAITRVGAGGSQVLETKGRLVLFRSVRRGGRRIVGVPGRAERANGDVWCADRHAGGEAEEHDRRGGRREQPRT
jgi:hypothetical protein